MSQPNDVVQIVIIGGSYGGIAAAQTLASKLPSHSATITLVEKFRFHFHSIGTLRAMVDPSFKKMLYIPNDNVFPKKAKHGKVIRAIADKIEEKRILIRKIDLEDKIADTTETIDFDYLIIATGSSYPAPIKPNADDISKTQIDPVLDDLHKKIQAADRILIIGGGSVGIEMAGEIACAYEDKKITMIDSNSELISSQQVRPKFRTRLMQELKKLKVEILLNEKLDERLTEHSFETKTLKTKSGKEITSDLQLVCAGMNPIVSLIESWDETVIEKGKIKVKDTLQLEGGKNSNIFAVGDANNHQTPKMAYWAGQQGEHLGKSLAAKILTDKALVPFKPPTSEVIMIPLGPKGGVSQFPVFGGTVLGSTVTSAIKSKDLFVGKMWSNLNAKAPS